MVGVDRPRGWSGRSLKAALAGTAAPSAPPPPRAAFSEGAWTFWIGSVTEENRKFILVTPQERMLFDLAQRSRPRRRTWRHRIRIACGRCTTSS